MIQTASCCATRIWQFSRPIQRYYADYVAAVREEYAQLPEEEFLAGRLALLTELADREIFRTAKGRQLSDAARANLAAEMNALRDRLGIAVEGSDG